MEEIQGLEDKQFKIITGYCGGIKEELMALTFYKAWIQISKKIQNVLNELNSLRTVHVLRYKNKTFQLYRAERSDVYTGSAIYNDIPKLNPYIDEYNQLLIDIQYIKMYFTRRLCEEGLDRNLLPDLICNIHPVLCRQERTSKFIEDIYTEKAIDLLSYYLAFNLIT